MNSSMHLSSHSRRLVPLALIALAALGLESAAGAPAGAPRLSSAKAVDADRDGSVDAFDLTFSGAVRGKADKSAPFRFGAAGYRVTGAAAPKGRKVRIQVAEAGTCDLASRPRVSYRPGADGLQTSKRRPLRASSVVAGRAARGAPKLICAATADSDSDGHIDAVVLGYSKKVRNRAQSSGRMPFQVDRYSVASVTRARGLNISLRLREKESYDTDALPAVIYRTPTVKRDRRFAVAGSGGKARSSTFNRTRDRAVPRLLSTATADSDQDGSLDAVRAQFSEPVRPGRGSADVAGTDVTGVSAARSALTVDLREGPLGTGSRPNVVLGADNSLRDSAGNPTGRLTSTPSDAASPVVTSARTADGGGASGRIDALALTFSEQVSHSPDADGAYPFSVSGYAIRSAGGASGNAMTLSLTESAAPDGGVRPVVGYARGSGAPVTDGAGNEAASRSFGGTADGVAPVLLRAALLDTNLNGQVDAARYDFSEPVVHSPANCPSCSFSLGGGYDLGSAGPGVGASVTVTVVEEDNDVTMTTAGYSPLAGGVTDPSGNRAPAATVSTADASPPVALDARTVDSVASPDGEPRIDEIEVTFSEPISVTVDNAPPFSFTTEGHQVTGVTPVGPDKLSIAFEESPDADTGSAPMIAYNGLGNRLTDVNGTEHAVRSYPLLTRDDVAPSFIEARTADADGNGGLDAVDLIFSEELTGPVQADPFPGFSTSGGQVNEVDYQSDRVRVSFDEAGTPNTGALPTFSYASATGGLEDRIEGNGDTPDAAPSASGAARDAAAPVVVDADTGEDEITPDGKIDSLVVTLSEPIQYTDGQPAALALTDPSLTITDVVRSGNQLTATVQEEALPNGGARPDVTVSDPERVTDLSPAANPATDTPYDATDDEVGPALTTAQNGEEATDGSCATAPVDGQVDCFRAMWSETVTQPTLAGAFDNTPQAPLDVMTTAAAAYTDVRVAEGGNDRDVAGEVRYVGGTEVEDNFSNPAVAAPAIAKEAACADSGVGSSEDAPNDVRDDANPTFVAFDEEQKLCANDPDWWQVTAGPSGVVSVLVDPAPQLQVIVRLVGSDGTTLGGPVTSEADGAAAILLVEGLAPDATYWVEIRSAGLGEGSYCGDPSAASDGCDDGDETPE